MPCCRFFLVVRRLRHGVICILERVPRARPTFTGHSFGCFFAFSSNIRATVPRSGADENDLLLRGQLRDGIRLHLVADDGIRDAVDLLQGSHGAHKYGTAGVRFRLNMPDVAPALSRRDQYRR